MSRIEVHPASPGRRFTAVVGLDHHADTARGKGSVSFKVPVGNELAFDSGVRRFGTAACEGGVDPAVGFDAHRVIGHNHAVAPNTSSLQPGPAHGHN